MVQAERRLVVLYVTHNLDDAFAVGHRLAVVRDGRIEQIGRIDDVFTRPANRHVLDILGIPNAMNAWVIETGPSGSLLDWDGIFLEAPPIDTRLWAPRSPRTFARKIFASCILIVRSVAWSLHNHLEGIVVERRLERHMYRLRVALPMVAD
jgi:molybdate transport system ATP-binding protein